jgi:hypothetical protein
LVPESSPALCRRHFAAATIIKPPIHACFRHLPGRHRLPAHRLLTDLVSSRSHFPNIQNDRARRRLFIPALNRFSGTNTVFCILTRRPNEGPATTITNHLALNNSANGGLPFLLPLKQPLNPRHGLRCAERSYAGVRYVPAVPTGPPLQAQSRAQRLSRAIPSGATTSTTY